MRVTPARRATQAAGRPLTCATTVQPLAGGRGVIRRLGVAAGVGAGDECGACALGAAPRAPAGAERPTLAPICTYPATITATAALAASRTGPRRTDTCRVAFEVDMLLRACLGANDLRHETLLAPRHGRR